MISTQKTDGNQANLSNLIGVLSGGFVCGVTLALLGSLESRIIEDLAVPHAMTGLAQSTLFIGNLAGSILMSGLMYRFSPRRLGIGALLLMLLGNVLSAVRVYEIIALARLIAGFGYSGAVIFFGAVVVHAYPQRQATLLSLYHASFGVGAASVLLLAPTLTTVLGGWQATFWVGGLICLAPLAAFTMARLPQMRSGESFSAGGMIGALRSPVIIVTFLVTIFYIAAEQALTVFMSSFAQKELAFSITAATQIAALFWIGVMVGRLVIAILSRSVSEPPLMIICATLMAALMIGGFTARQPAPVYISTFLVGVCAGPLVPLAFSYSVRGAGQFKSAIVAMCNVAICIGGILGPVMVGAIGDRFSLEQGLTVSAVCLLASIVPFFVVTRRIASVDSAVRSEQRL